MVEEHQLIATLLLRQMNKCAVCGETLEVFQVYKHGGSFALLCRECYDQRSAPCPKCSTVSFNPNDVKNRYCARCHGYYVDLL